MRSQFEKQFKEEVMKEKHLINQELRNIFVLKRLANSSSKFYGHVVEASNKRLSRLRAKVENSAAKASRNKLCVMDNFNQVYTYEFRHRFDNFIDNYNAYKRLKTYLEKEFSKGVEVTSGSFSLGENDNIKEKKAYSYSFKIVHLSQIVLR